MRRRWFVLTACAGAAASTAACAQTYQPDVGYAQLVDQLTAANQPVPNGSGVLVTQVEALNYGGYFPDTTDTEFSGKTITDKTIPAQTPPPVSGHATAVGQYFYGKDSSFTPGITTISVYDADDWLEDDFLNTGSDAAPDATNERVGNHSYIGAFPTNALTLEALERFDYVIQHDNYINVVAENDPNGNSPGTATPLMADSFNAISVGLSDGLAASVTTNQEDDPQNLYVAGRAAPDVVVPQSATSWATPIVSSTAAMLVEVAHDNPSLSKGTVYSWRTGLTLEYGETNDVIKAAIMAGADRIIGNGDPNDVLANYGADPTQNGLDSRYGAGQLNVDNSYQIIAAGQQTPGTIKTYGFDFNPSSSDTAVEDYTFSGQTGVTATLAWNLHVAYLGGESFSASLAHFELTLYQLNANGGSISLATSASMIDNTQNIFALLNPADTYELQVSRNDTLGNWDYGLAWDLDPVPEPVGGMGGVVGLVLCMRRRRPQIRNPKEIPSPKSQVGSSVPI